MKYTNNLANSHFKSHLQVSTLAAVYGKIVCVTVVQQHVPQNNVVIQNTTKFVKHIPLSFSVPCPQ